LAYFELSHREEERLAAYEYSFLSIFFLALLFWITFSFGLIVWRWSSQKQQQQLNSACAMLSRDAASSTPENLRRVRPFLRRIPRSVLDGVIADTSLPHDTSSVFAAYQLRRYGIGRLLRDARGHRSTRDKWRRTSALYALCHAAHPDKFVLLAKALEDQDKDVVDAAVTLLGQMQNAEAAELLVDALRQGFGVPTRVAAQLDGFDIDLSASLRLLLKHHSAYSASVGSFTSCEIWLGGKRRCRADAIDCRSSSRCASCFD
jgi:hypothetical protein